MQGSPLWPIYLDGRPPRLSKFFQKIGYCAPKTKEHAPPPMKIPFLSTALAAVLGLALCGTAANAQTTNAPATTAPAPTTAPSSKVTKTPYKGTITAIDATGSTVTIQGAKDTMTLKITSATKYKGGAALTDFAVGDKVTGSYTKGDDGTLTAASLHKKKATAAAAAPAAPAAQ
jgi:hypothetical protein